jgi:hypothetical protein
MAYAKEKTENLHGTNVNVDSGYCKDVLYIVDLIWVE